MNPYTVRSVSLFCAAYLIAGGVLFAGEADAPKSVDAGKADVIVNHLGDDIFEEREAATKALNQLGESALPALEKAERSDDAEIRRRAADLVESIESRLDREVRAVVKELGGSFRRIDDHPDLMEVSLRGAKIRNEDLKRLRWFRSTGFLDLSGTQVTGSGLAYLHGIAQLKELRLTSNNTTDDDLAPLEGMKHLERLWVSGDHITDECLVHLEGLSNLTLLKLGGKQLTGAGLAHLKSLKKLQILDCIPPR